MDKENYIWPLKLIQSNQSWISYWKILMKIQETLYSKNNNNWHFLFFLVQQIIVLFLKVSHTHESADQYLFKDIARKSLPTLPILRDLAREAYHPMSNVQRLENIWDYKQMLISSKVQLVGHSSPHQLKFVKMGIKCWCISRNGISSPQHIRSLTSPAWPLRTKMTLSQFSRLQKKEERFFNPLKGD